MAASNYRGEISCGGETNQYHIVTITSRILYFFKISCDPALEIKIEIILIILEDKFYAEGSIGEYHCNHAQSQRSCPFNSVEVLNYF